MLKDPTRISAFRRLNIRLRVSRYRRLRWTGKTDLRMVWRRNAKSKHTWRAEARSVYVRVIRKSIRECRYTRRFLILVLSEWVLLRLNGAPACHRWCPAVNKINPMVQVSPLRSRVLLIVRETLFNIQF